MSNNPLLFESNLPYHYPPFDLIKDAHFAPAYERGMLEERKEVTAIADNPAAPTFDNTIVALERSGQLLARVDRIFSNLASCNTNSALQEIERDLAPKLSAQRDALQLNPALFARVQALYDQRSTLGLDPESLRLLERYHRDFVRAGAQLSETEKTKLKALNAEIATLQTTFSQNVLKEINASSVLVADRKELAGLPEAEITAAADAAKAEGHAGQFSIHLVNTTGQPPLTTLENRALRERIMQASLARGSRGGEFDNRATVAALARLRAERATLLGYPTHAAYTLEEQTARTVETVDKLLAKLAPAAVANARLEAADMQAIIDREKGGFQLGAQDWALYSEKVRAARYAFDESQVRPYLELEHVLKDGVFFAAHELYGLTFKERKDLPVYLPEVRVFEVFEADGSPLAVFIADYYARPSKNGGAWMSEYVPQSALLGFKAVVANHLNIPKPAPGEPALLTFDEVTTMFHEFGHALHGMFSRVKYPLFSGTNVPRDFVEYPSQVNEMWAAWPEVLTHYAKHYQTGAPLPPALLEKVLNARKFDQGFKTTEYLAASLLDLAWHELKPAEVPAADGVVAFETAVLKKAGVDFPPVPPRYRSTYFSHVFAGGYSAGYYSYIWAEVLDADSVEWFKQHGGLKRENGDHFRSTLLSRGGSEEALAMYRKFRGADPDIKPLLERRGLAQPASSEKK
jgi:peptidyl-dipeptidase Dcp